MEKGPEPYKNSAFLRWQSKNEKNEKNGFLAKIARHWPGISPKNAERMPSGPKFWNAEKLSPKHREKKRACLVFRGYFVCIFGVYLVHHIAAFAFANLRCQWRHRCVVTLGEILVVLCRRPLWRKEKWKQRPKGDARDVKKCTTRCCKTGWAITIK